MGLTRTIHTTLLCASLFSAALSSDAWASNFTGLVLDDSNQPTWGVRVAFLDAENAVILGVTATDPNGMYDSGPLPAGDYKIRFYEDGPTGASYYVGSYFYGSNLDNDFCTAAVLTLPPDTTITADGYARAGRSVLKIRNDTVSGLVVDELSGAPLQGIHVDLLHGDDTEPIATAITDEYGNYVYPFEVPAGSTVVVRFSDPSGTYRPEFHGAGDLDDFCLATEISLDSSGFVVNGALAPIPAEQLTQDLVDSVTDLALPDSVENNLRTPLTRVAVALTDGNPNNDASVCNRLDSFITRVDIQEARGTLSTADADVLRLQALAIQVAIGCQ